MAESMGAGDLLFRVRFDERTETEDGYGNTRGEWVPRFTRRADIRPTKGTEAVMAARLDGRQPALIIVRLDSDTKRITTDWRLVELHADGSETPYAIRDARDMERDRQFLTILAEAGVAEG